jgi:hypothetical protein
MTSFVTTLVKVEAEPGIEPGLADLQSVTLLYYFNGLTPYVRTKWDLLGRLWAGFRNSLILYIRNGEE